ncbi:SusC/RagA family TonB-linked outer membrane protein [Flavobacterium sp. '19STA2R22 D10 B1']|uniref:SusC/RagA family TonB-linked outer membrane protein n=1 Tax=Flavobacterium aerium TaxID=3037261 RepID=UPI00278C7242|nr:TonB-dependent receptor [Flavobacterium sp. '19STA2R22 D10 B1']
MKTMYKKLLLLVLMFPISILAQNTLSGTVKDQTSGLPLPGVNVVAEGTTTGTMTDFDGNFALPNLKKGDKIVFSFIGFKSHVLNYEAQKSVSIILQEDASILDEIVVIGYGNVKKKDATGSVTTVTASQFNKGPVVAADQMLQGKVAGLQIINDGGAPGEGALIRIRSGSSLAASNDPLYVIDGVPVEYKGIKGGRNPLASINQNNIESITVLKDASATAIYGSRASNGVIIITTKKGKAGELSISYNGNYSVGRIADQVDVLNADQYRTYVNTNGSTAQKALLGNANTDWQKEIFQTATGTDHSIALTGGDEKIVYRASVGYSDMNGILKRDNFQRTTLSGGFTTHFFDNHLKIEANNNTSIIKNNFSDKLAIGAALSFDPTQSVYANNNYGGYFQWLEPNGMPLQLPGKNPLSLINQKNNYGDTFRSIGNIQFDYKMHFLPELKAILNLGYDYNSGRKYSNVDRDFIVLAEQGSYVNEVEDRNNKLMDFYFNYNKSYNGFISNLDVTAGYSYQDFKTYYKDDYYNNAQGLVDNDPGRTGKTRINLQSFFARTNISIYDKYLVTLSYRRDGTSRFTKDNRWGNFPSAAVAWKINNENFLKDSKIVNDLKFRASWGITGQQDIQNAVYPSKPLYQLATETASYQIGYDANGKPIFFNPVRPQPYNPNLKWEETTTWNMGIDFGLLNNRITGTVDVYKRTTTDLIVKTPNPQGVAFSNEDNYNIGDLENKGLEIGLNFIPVQNDNFKWNIGGNITFQDSKIKKLTLITDPSYLGQPVGGIEGATGNTIQRQQTGYTPFSYYVYQQAYDADGRPLNGVYVDRNGDGIINAEDKYLHHSANADLFFGFNTSIEYKNWDFSMAWRGSIGNYNYNNVDARLGFQEGLLIRQTDISNGTVDILNTGFVKPSYESDYYIQNASFLRMDNATIGYTFKDLFRDGSTLRITGAVQNAFIITNYKGIDPEIKEGRDNNLYPRPRTYMLGLNVNF